MLTFLLIVASTVVVPMLVVWAFHVIADYINTSRLQSFSETYAAIQRANMLKEWERENFNGDQWDLRYREARRSFMKLNGLI
jgi:hypothetical protein